MQAGTGRIILLMKFMNSKYLSVFGTVFYLFLFIIGLFFLDQTPVVNNDEYWIGDAALRITEGDGFNVKIYPELYETIKSNKTLGYSLLQALMIKIFGFNLFALRILSYLSIFIAGLIIWQYAKRMEYKNGVLLGLLFVCNPYIWHIGHVGRPEAVLVLLSVWSLFLLKTTTWNYQRILLLIMVSGLSFMIYVLGVFLILFISAVLVINAIKGTLLKKYLFYYGALLSIIMFFYLGLQGWENLYITYTGHEMKAANLFGSYSKALTFYLNALVISKMAWTAVILLFTILFVVIKSSINNVVFKAENKEILLYILVTTMFFIFLRRTNMYYVALIITGILMLIFMNKELVKKSTIYVSILILINLTFVLFYLIIYPHRENIKKINFPDNACVMAPIQFRDQMLNQKNFIAIEDYKGLLKGGTRSFEEYIKKHNVEYVLLDEFTQSQWYAGEILQFVSEKAVKVSEGRSHSLGTRAYEDIPYYLSLRNAASLIKSRPAFKWSIYKIKD
jgi:4-amino-4-deoxy-L-arabinose transferase-like glycosyltransferase